MKIVNTELLVIGEKRDLNGKKYFPKKELGTKIVEYENSGLTHQEFAEKEGIKYATFIP